MNHSRPPIPEALPQSGRVPFAALVRDIVETDGGTKSDIARAIHVNGSQLSRVLHGKGVFGPETCLRLALVSGRSALYVLRVAGHSRFAELLGHLFGAPAVRARSRLTAAEERFALGLRDLPASDRDAFVHLVTVARRAAAPPRAKRL